MSSKEVNNGMSTTLMSNGQAVSTSPDWPGYREAEASAIACNLVLGSDATNALLHHEDSERAR